MLVSIIDIVLSHSRQLVYKKREIAVTTSSCIYIGGRMFVFHDNFGTIFAVIVHEEKMNRTVPALCTPDLN